MKMNQMIRNMIYVMCMVMIVILFAFSAIYGWL